MQVRKKKFLEYLELGQYSFNTKKQYTYYLNILLDHSRLGNITQDDVDTLITKHNNRVFRAFLKQYINLFNFQLNVPKIKGRASQKRLKYLDKTEVAKLINESPTRESVLIELMFLTGLRISEALNIKPTDIDRVNLTIKGVGKGNKEFLLPITNRILERLDGLKDSNLQEYNQPYIFYEGIEHPRIKVVKELELISMSILGKKVTPHMIRHSCGTYLREKNWDLREIQEFLRHSNLETTKVYTHIDSRKLRDKWDNLFSEPTKKNSG